MARKMGPRDEAWRARIAAQKQSGVSVKQFCAQQGLTEQSFYYWRKRLQAPASMRFALVEAEPRRGPAEHAALELVLTTGERLRISAGVDARTLQQVLEALRA
ncbi:MAG: helix-turn-helix domain containing protein [Acidobacteriia bacterium]|nr:helix-turn-helix domain containing protein [Terriglobia bacterium]